MSLFLQPITDTEYREWRAIVVPEYAAEKVANGAWPADDSLRRSVEALDALLPQGRNTAGQFIYSIRSTDPDGGVGFLWFGVKGGRAYLYDLFVKPEHRRRGYARGAMRLLEEAARKQGFDSIGLHVFGRNTGARDLYLSQGYRITDLMMQKDLPPDADPARREVRGG